MEDKKIKRSSRERLPDSLSKKRDEKLFNEIVKHFDAWLAQDDYDTDEDLMYWTFSPTGAIRLLENGKLREVAGTTHQFVEETFNG